MLLSGRDFKRRALQGGGAPEEDRSACSALAAGDSPVNEIVEQAKGFTLISKSRSLLRLDSGMALPRAPMNSISPRKLFRQTGISFQGAYSVET
jgi:hypothetical protein